VEAGAQFCLSATDAWAKPLPVMKAAYITLLIGGGNKYDGEAYL
jgi:hypothetical protein